MSLYSRGKARRSLIDTVLFRALSQVATVASLIVLVRGMSKEGFGVYSLLYSFIPVVSTVASLGLEQILRRYQPEYLRAQNLVAAAWLVRVVSSARFCVNVILLGALLLGWNYLAPLFQLTPYRGLFALFSLLIVLHFQSQIMQLTLASHMLHRYSVGAIASLSILKLVAYSALTLTHALTLQSVIYADIASYGLVYLFVRIAYIRYAAPADSRGHRPPPDERRRIIRYGIYNNFNDAGSLMMDAKIDNFFIAAFIDPISVGVYAFFTRLDEMTNNVLPIRLFENVVQPMFFAIPGDEAKRRLPQYFTFLLNINLLLQWPLLAFCFVYHAEIVGVVSGGKFLEYSWLLPLVVGFSTMNIFGTPATLVAQYREQPGVVLLSKIFAVYNIVAMIVLVPGLGLYGAALARGSAQVMKNLFIWWHVRHDAIWTNARAAVIGGVLIWGLAVLICTALRTYWNIPPLLQLVVGAVVCGVMMLIHVRSAAIAIADRELLLSLFSGKEARGLQWLGLVPFSRTKLASEA